MRDEEGDEDEDGEVAAVAETEAGRKTCARLRRRELRQLTFGGRENITALRMHAIARGCSGALMVNAERMHNKIMAP